MIWLWDQLVEGYAALHRENPAFLLLLCWGMLVGWILNSLRRR